MASNLILLVLSVFWQVNIIMASTESCLFCLFSGRWTELWPQLNPACFVCFLTDEQNYGLYWILLCFVCFLADEQNHGLNWILLVLSVFWQMNRIMASTESCLFCLFSGRWTELWPQLNPACFVCFLANEQNYGLIRPSLIRQLRAILDQYPDDGQILKVSYFLCNISVLHPFCG